MPTPESIRKTIADLKKAEAALRKTQSDHETSAAKKRSEASRKRDSSARTSSESMKRSYLKAATKLEEDTAGLDRKAADVAKKVGDNLTKQQQAAVRLTSAEESAAQARDREDERRRQRERQHAREVARLARPTVRYVHEVKHVPAPKPEQLRVLYLTANPRVVEEDPDGEVMVTRIRVDLEVRNVREAVKRALHR